MAQQGLQHYEEKPSPEGLLQALKQNTLGAMVKRLQRISANWKNTLTLSQQVQEMAKLTCHDIASKHTAHPCQTGPGKEAFVEVME